MKSWVLCMRIVFADSEYEALSKEYKYLFLQLMSVLTDEQQKTLLRLDEIASRQEGLSNEIIACELQT